MMEIVLQINILFGGMSLMKNNLKKEYLDILNKLEISLLEVKKIENVLYTYKNNNIDLNKDKIIGLENILEKLNKKTAELLYRAKKLKQETND